MIRIFLSSQVRLTRNAFLALCRYFLTQGTLRSIHGHQRSILIPRDWWPCRWLAFAFVLTLIYQPRWHCTRKPFPTLKLKVRHHMFYPLPRWYVRSLGFGASQLWCKFWLCHSLTLWPWVSDSTSLCFCFCFWKIVIIVPNAERCCQKDMQ